MVGVTLEEANLLLRTTLQLKILIARIDDAAANLEQRGDIRRQICECLWLLQALETHFETLRDDCTEALVGK